MFSHLYKLIKREDMAIKNKRSSDVKLEAPAEKKVKFDKKVSTFGEKKVFPKPGGNSSKWSLLIGPNHMFV